MAKSSKRKIHLTAPLLAIVALAGVGALLYAALKPQPIAVEMGHTSRGAMELVVHEDGHSRVKQRYTISAPLAGTFPRQRLEPGDAVKEGDVVASLLPLPPALLDERARYQANARVAAATANERRAKANIARASATLAFNRAEAERRGEGHKKEYVSDSELERSLMGMHTAKQDLESARFAARVAAYELRVAEAALGSVSKGGESSGQLNLAAPVAGSVLKVLHRSEGVVQPGTALLEIGDTGQLEAVVDVLTTDAVNIKVGAEARIVRWGGRLPLAARVRSKEPSAFSTRSALGVEEQRVNVVLELTDPPEKRQGLGDGYRIEADIQIWKSDDSLRVPASAVFRNEGGWAVFAVNEGHAEHVRIEVGRHGPDFVEVLGGLEDGQSVVLYPSDRIGDGSPVEAR